MSNICEHLPEYRDWLVSLVNGEGYSKLCACMMNTYVDPLSPLMQYGNNIDRLKDCDELRKDWDPNYIPSPVNNRGYSILEMTIALARRMEFIIGSGDYESFLNCFWELMQNLGFDQLVDEDFESLNGLEIVRKTVRELEKNEDKSCKTGCFFPINSINFAPNRTKISQKWDKNGTKWDKMGQNGAKNGQKNKEIWYQMNEYLMPRV